MRNFTFPPGSRREAALYNVLHGIKILRQEGIGSFFTRWFRKLSWQIKTIVQGIRFKLTRLAGAKVYEVSDIRLNPQPQPHQSSVDIIIYIHNTLADFQICLESVLHHTNPPFTITLVDDASDETTRSHLCYLARIHHFTLVRTDTSLGSTEAMSRSIRQSTAEFVLLLNGKVIVTPGWLDGMLACAQSNPKIGMVGALSNSAINQSNPDITTNGFLADYPLPVNITPTQMGEFVAKYSGRLYPEVSSLHDSCLLIRRQVIDQIETFGDDYCMSVQQAGWQLALADDVYFNQPVGKELGRSPDDDGIADKCGNRILEGIRSHNRYIFERENLIQHGHERFANRRVLFVLPVRAAGGGSNLVFLAARAMRQMGVDAQIMNLHIYRPSFERSYPNASVPILYGEAEDVSSSAADFDAVIATSNTSVSWIAPALNKRSDLVVGYYIQDYEPLFLLTGF